MGLTDPVGRGLVASLAHPGGNVTGLTNTVGVQIAGKRLQLLKEAVPTVSRLAALDYSSRPPNPASPFRREFEAAAQALNVTLQSYYVVRGPEELEGAFTAMTKAWVEAFFAISAKARSARARGESWSRPTS